MTDSDRDRQTIEKEKKRRNGKKETEEKTNRVQGFSPNHDRLIWSERFSGHREHKTPQPKL